MSAVSDVRLPYLDAATVTRLVPIHDAVDLLEAALRDGLDPEAETPRTVIGVDGGQLLLMPAASSRTAGVKLVTVAPAGTERGVPRVQGVYVLFDGETLAPCALLDGAAITALRTPAVSAVAARHLAPADARRLVVFGSGPQAWGHVAALRAIRPIHQIAVVGRDAARLDAFLTRCREAGVAVDPAGAEAVAQADIVACCTTAREPLFDGRLPPEHATVIAVGSHEPDAREVDAELVRRSTVVVEARSAALREAGDVVQAIGAGALDADRLVSLADLVRGIVHVEGNRPRLFKSVGMAWEDLIIAGAVYERWREAGRG